MRFLAVDYPEKNSVVDIWSAAATVRLTSVMREKIGIGFSSALDELDNFEYAYLEADGIPVSFLRYDSEPEDIYTIQVDAAKLIEGAKGTVMAFILSLLEYYKIDSAEIRWLNSNLE